MSNIPEWAGLPFQSLYRRFRPQRFADVLGQSHISVPLLNSVRDDRTSHAYLFSGPRGTGKTSSARILAMALNCDTPDQGEPCGACQSCHEIQQGGSLNVIEMDAASNRRIEEMRDLLSHIGLKPPGRRRVYIIDEVHQLTNDAASTLLKTLEEPPAHVVFVLATTDPQRVLPTIRSRTIHFEFHLLNPATLQALVESVNQQAGLGLDQDTLAAVVQQGHGSARDTLTALDQAVAGGDIQDLSVLSGHLVQGLAHKDLGAVLSCVAQGMVDGLEPRRVATDLLAYLHDGFLLAMAPAVASIPPQARDKIEQQIKQMGLGAWVRAMETIGECLSDMRDSVDVRITLEIALVRLARVEVDIHPAALLERIERLERKLAS